MQFLNPLALAGLAAALIPLAVHLLHRGRPRVVPFSNVGFLRQVHLSHMRGLRLRQWLVLLLRMLAFACLALACARPALQEGAGLFGGSRPAAAVLLLDHSFSTRYSPPGGRAFDRLRLRADEVLSLYEDGRHRVSVIPFAARPDTADRASAVRLLRERLAARAPGEAGTDVSRALRAAGRQLARTPAARGEIYLFTDRARPGWEDMRPGLSGTNPQSLFVISPSGGRRRNLYVAEVGAAGWLAAPGTRLNIGARVGQSGGGEARLSVDLFLDGERVQRRRVQVPASGTAAVEFEVAPRRSGRLTGFVEVEADDLPLDNRRHFTLHVPDRISVLLAGPDRGDTYYARRALAAAATGDAALQVESVTFPELDEEALAGVDVLVLCHLEDPPPRLARQVRRFVEAGGGLLLLPGPQADLARLNRDWLPGLVPATLAGIAGRPGEEAYVALDSSRADARLFAGLVAESGDRPRFRARFDLVTRRQLSVLARFDDGKPALVEGRPGDGRALLWAVPLDLAWSDWPRSGSFVPLLHRLCRYLAQPAGGADYTVGDRAWRRLPGSRVDDRMQAQAPSGRRRFIRAETSLGDLRWALPPLEEAGIWRLVGPDGGVRDEFAVNVDAAESDLSAWPEQEIRRRLPGASLHFLDDETAVGERVLALRHGRELWRECLVLALVLLLLELWIGRAPLPKPAAQGPDQPSRPRSISKV